jgi:hypothetical protein
MWFIEGLVPCILCTAVLPPVITLVLLLPSVVAPMVVCQADSFGPPGETM